MNNKLQYWIELSHVKLYYKNSSEKNPFNLKFLGLLLYFWKVSSGANAIKKFTPSLGIPYLGVKTPR